MYQVSEQFHSQQAAQLASAYQMGEVQVEHRFRSMIIWFVTCCLSILFRNDPPPITFFAQKRITGPKILLIRLAALITFLILLNLYIFWPVSLAQALGSNPAGIVYYLILFFFSINDIGRFLLFYNSRLIVCTSGFLLIKRRILQKEATIHSCSWEEIHSYVDTSYEFFYSYKVNKVDGTVLKIDNGFDHLHAFGARLGREITRIRFPQVLAAYSAGSCLTFGPFNLDLDGVRVGKRSVPWKNIERFDFVRDTLWLYTRHAVMMSYRLKKPGWTGWTKIRVAKIPNITLFMALTDYILSHRKYRYGPN